MGAMSRPLILSPLRRTAADAETFARAVHEGQADKAGEPYAEHLCRVAGRTMAKVAGMPGILSAEIVSDTLQIAWLHDVIEDTPYGGKGLLREGFSVEVVRAVEMLSKPKRSRQPYVEWIAWLADTAPLTTILVKISDNEDNADSERLARLDEATRTRFLAKYDPSMAMLREAARAKGWQG